MATLPKKNSKKQRVVIITQGSDATIVAQAQENGDVKITVHDVNKIDSSKIVDTNGAGDAFAGGFLGILAQGKSLDEAVAGGHWLASESIALMGPNVSQQPSEISQSMLMPLKVPNPQKSLQGLRKAIICISNLYRSNWKNRSKQIPLLSGTPMKHLTSLARSLGRCKCNVKVKRRVTAS